ncbi:NfeD family protein [Candidatus Sumerlaeota bacterium]|nr:NfeD family protein [Candidatus Sumerlaeota bacterium]
MTSWSSLLGMFLFGLAFVVAGGFGIFVLFVRGFSLKSEMKAQDGYVSTDASLAELIGSVGVTLSVLRPGGMVEINGRRLDARAQGEYIESGKAIVVLGIDGAQLVVDDVPQTGNFEN